MVQDGELARRAGRGESAAAAELLTRIRPGVVRYCWAHLGSLRHALASPDDVAQEVCLAVFEALPRFRDRGMPFAAFVFRIAANKVADAYRAARAASSTQPIETLPEAADDQWDPERRAVTADLSRRVLSLLADLSDTQREIVVLRVAAGLSADEVGAVLGMTPAAVRMSQSRALANLRARVRDQDAADEVVA
ncbi:RNA polymerase sigma-70 factor (ECF subfamily) [Lentzea atacamensis]|uniref:RNA polymerase sigma-70 factor (ECF subfamily) n=1 Tax=Lentzea atacamensis TaxID=531938 RepID=A0A316IAS2_9PSEU|nr:RNA polymerase sigma-70 factor (ECF subfamily) [Lentzea atacamensis]